MVRAASDGDVTSRSFYTSKSSEALPLRHCAARLQHHCRPDTSDIVCPLPALPRLPGARSIEATLHFRRPFLKRWRNRPAGHKKGTEERLACIWEDVLGIPVIPGDADFFSLAVIPSKFSAFSTGFEPFSA